MPVSEDRKARASPRRWVGGGLFRKVELRPSEFVLASVTAYVLGVGRAFVTNERLILVSPRGWPSHVDVVDLAAIREVELTSSWWFGNNIRFRTGRLNWLETTAGPAWYLLSFSLIFLPLGRLFRRFDKSRELYEAVESARAGIAAMDEANRVEH